jgi:hypothetical protein
MTESRHAETVRRSSFLVSTVGAVSGALIAAASCGPSVQSIHESNVRFEHCYRLDLDRVIAPNHRQACWREWVDRYTYGQTRDRIEYGRRRMRAIAAGQLGTSLSLDASVHDAGTDPDAAPVPAPISIHAPPPAVAPGPARPTEAASATDAGSADASSPAPTPPGAECNSACETTWGSCKATCADGQDAGAAKRCAVCETDYKACMRRCFK